MNTYILVGVIEKKTRLKPNNRKLIIICQWWSMTIVDLHWTFEPRPIPLKYDLIQMHNVHTLCPYHQTDIVRPSFVDHRHMIIEQNKYCKEMTTTQSATTAFINNGPLRFMHFGSSHGLKNWSIYWKELKETPMIWVNNTEMEYLLLECLWLRWIISTLLHMQPQLVRILGWE